MRYLRDPIWQFMGVVVGIATLFAMVAIANPTLVQRWWLPGLLGAAALIVLAATVRFWRLIIRGFDWVRREIKRIYLRILWHLVIRPAKDHLELMIWPDRGHVGTEELTDLRNRVSGLESDALQVLEAVLVEYDPMWEGDLLIRPATIPLSPAPKGFPDRETRVALACDHLKTRRVIADYEVWAGKGGYKVRLTLHHTLRPALIPEARELVVDELVSRNIGPLRFRDLPVRVAGLWRYDFCENLPAAKALRHTGSDIELHPEAICDGETKRGIFEHPPDDAAKWTTLTYPITPPSELSLIELTGFVGIETHRPTSDGLQPSGRQPDNHVEFEIKIDDQVRFKQRKETSQWQKFSILFVARGDSISICLSTNNLGQNAYNWAVWGEPELVELLRLAERASSTDKSLEVLE